MPKLTFEKWMGQVNAEIHNRIQLTVDDIADKPYWRWWDEGKTATAAAKAATKSA